MLDTDLVFSQYARHMAWQPRVRFRHVEGAHYRAICECGTDAIVCCKREPKGAEAVTSAIRLLQRGGWHGDGLAGGQHPEDVRRLCPKCAKAERHRR